MPLGKTSYANGEVIVEIFFDEGAQLAGIIKIFRAGSPVGLAFRGISAQGQDVFDAARLDFREYLADFFLGVADTGQVGDARDPVRLLDMLDYVECFSPVPAARAVCAGDEVRLEFG